MSYDCRRPDCPESFESQLKYDIHLLTEHPLPWESIADYPRAPSQR